MIFGRLRGLNVAVFPGKLKSQSGSLFSNGGPRFHHKIRHKAKRVAGPADEAAIVVSRYGRHEVLWDQPTLDRVLGSLQLERLQRRLDVSFDQAARCFAIRLATITALAQEPDDTDTAVNRTERLMSILFPAMHSLMESTLERIEAAEQTESRTIPVDPDWDRRDQQSKQHMNSLGTEARTVVRPGGWGCHSREPYLKGYFAARAAARSDLKMIVRKF
jgi:hypothetical protein